MKKQDKKLKIKKTLRSLGIFAIVLLVAMVISSLWTNNGSNGLFALAAVVRSVFIIVLVIFAVNLISYLVLKSKESKAEADEKYRTSDTYSDDGETKQNWGEKLGTDIADGIRPAITQIKSAFKLVKGEFTGKDSHVHENKPVICTCEFCGTRNTADVPKCISCGAALKISDN